MKDYINLENFYYDEETWLSSDYLFYDILKHKAQESFYSNITDSAKSFIINEVLKEIDEEDRLLIEMIYYEGFSIARASNILDIPSTTLFLKIHSILEKIRKKIEAKYDYKIFENRQKIHNI